jgi:hypothetical protein
LVRHEVYGLHFHRRRFFRIRGSIRIIRKEEHFFALDGWKFRDVGAEKERIHATDESIERGHSLA